MPGNSFVPEDPAAKRMSGSGSGQNGNRRQSGAPQQHAYVPPGDVGNQAPYQPPQRGSYVPPGYDDPPPPQPSGYTPPQAGSYVPPGHVDAPQPPPVQYPPAQKGSYHPPGARDAPQAQPTYQPPQPGGYVPPGGSYVPPLPAGAPAYPAKAAGENGPSPEADALAGAMEGYPGAFGGQPLPGQGQEDDEDPTLKALNDTYPSFIISVICKAPRFCLFLMFLLLLAVAGIAVARPPNLTTSFDTLQIKDHDVAARQFSIKTLEDENTFYDRPVAGPDSSRRRLLDDVQALYRQRGAMDGTERAGRSLLQDEEEEERGNELTHFLIIFFRYADESRSAIDLEMVEKAHNVEARILEHPVYQQICLRDGRGGPNGCAFPFSFSTLVYLDEDDSGQLALAEEPQMDIEATAKALVDRNITYFFDVNSDGEYAKWIRSIVFFSEPDKKLYKDPLIDFLIDMFEEESSDDIIINYGESNIIDRQIKRQILADSAWAGLSMVFAGLMLRIGTGSWFMTLAGIFQIAISFPISWIFYSAPRDWEFINVMHFLAPFVMLGIGLDDIFVSVSFFQNTRPFMGHFALDTRLTLAFSKASGAMLATSTTSAFAFAANIFSPVPTVQSFGLLLAVLVIVNFVLAITWLPICLAVWDIHFEFPQRLAEEEGRSTCCASTLCCCCGCGSRRRRSGAQGGGRQQGLTGKLQALGGNTMSIVRGGQQPRALEFMQVVLPFYKPKKVAEAIARHRLLHPDKEPRIVVSPVELAKVEEDNAPSCFGRKIDVKHYIGWLFDTIFRFRFITITLCLIISFMGMIGTIRLESPPTSEPPLFDSDHNVQFFFQYRNSEEADNVPSCVPCLVEDISLLSQAGDDPAALLELDPESLTPGDFSTVVADLVWGISEDGIDNSPNVKGDPAGDPVDNILTYEILLPEPTLDFASKETQLMIKDVLADMFEGDGTPKSEGAGTLVNQIDTNPLDVLMVEFCNNEDVLADPSISQEVKDACGRADPDTGLPLGEDFRLVVYAFIVLTPEGVNQRDFIGYAPARLTGGENAFDFVGCVPNCERMPDVAFVRIRLRTVTSKGDSPEDLQASFDRFTTWVENVSEPHPYKGLFAASPDWVIAVTYVKIADSVYGTVFLSIGLACAVVFAFSGLRMMIFAGITVLMINLTVMGVLYIWDWDLGAVEGMSITSLVGLSVDFCIHIAEAHVKAQSRWRPTDATAKLQAGFFSCLCNSQPLGLHKAREALILVAVPMTASALSTVITTTPLFATTTLILNRFASVIFITMLAGLLYVFLFLSPLLAMFGPGVKKARDKSKVPTYRQVLLEHLGSSEAVRFVLVMVLMLIIVNVIPSTRKSIKDGGTIGDLVQLLLALCIVALFVVIFHTFIRAGAHYRDYKGEAEQVQAERQQQVEEMKNQMAQPYMPRAGSV